MNKPILLGKERTTLELAALFIFVLVLVANLAVVRFSAGYFEHYGISLAEVNYAPRMYDYLQIALPIIIASVVVSIISLCLIAVSFYLGNLLAKFTKPSKKAIKYVRKHRRFFERLAYTLGLLVKVSLVAVSVWILWTALYSISAEAGRVSAENASKLTSISKDGEDLQQIIIYKGDNELILKTYDTSKRNFLDGYRVTSDMTYDARAIDL